MAEVREYTVAELNRYNGEGPDGRILVALNGQVYDVTENGGQFYSKGGPYEMFAGKDATRGLSAFSLVPKKNQDPLDLSTLELRHYRNGQHWEKTFKAKYQVVGILKDGSSWDPKIVEEYEQTIKDTDNDKPPPQFGFRDAVLSSKSPDVASTSAQANQEPGRASRDPAPPLSRDSGKRDDLGSIVMKEMDRKLKKPDSPANDTGKNGDTGKSSEETNIRIQPQDTTLKKKNSRLCILF